MSISDKSVDYIKENKKKLIEKFSNLEEFPSTSKPEAIFMAGSPGAGKTEMSKSFLEIIFGKGVKIPFVRIDPDDIRLEVPYYKGDNTEEVHKAAVIGAQKILDKVINSKQSFIFDGTFANLNKAKQNIDRCLKRNIKVTIIYVYQDPIVAWKLTQKREKLEGRPVPIDVFVNAFFKSRKNVNEVKNIYKSKIELHFITRNYESNLFKLKLNIDKVDNFIKNEYNPQALKKKLKNEKIN